MQQAVVIISIIISTFTLSAQGNISLTIKKLDETFIETTIKNNYPNKAIINITANLMSGDIFAPVPFYVEPLSYFKIIAYKKGLLGLSGIKYKETNGKIMFNRVKDRGQTTFVLQPGESRKDTIRVFAGDGGGDKYFFGMSDRSKITKIEVEATLAVFVIKDEPQEPREKSIIKSNKINF